MRISSPRPRPRLVPLRWTVLALALNGLLLSGCRDKHEPLKPTVDLSAASFVVSALRAR